MAANYKLIPREIQDQIIRDIRSGQSVNELRSTGYGVNILKRILTENRIPYENNKGNKDRITYHVASYFTCTSASVCNAAVKSAIIKHNIIPHESCWNCGLSEWMQGTLTLELDHIDGNNKNNNISNLRFLCPNCHSQTPTFRGKNKTNGNKKKVSDDDLLHALNKESNIRKALLAVGLSPMGGNYNRAKRLLNDTSQSTSTSRY